LAQAACVLVKWYYAGINVTCNAVS